MKYKKIKSLKPLGFKKTYNVTMKEPFHNYSIHNKDSNKYVISENSHAVAYTYISSRLLYLKSHYPLEFFAGTLMLENDDKKIKEYKIDAKKFGININKVDINRSNWNFTISDGEIYMGFSNIKGIGESIAKEIVKGQPYNSFEDFLKRFGTEAKVIKPLLALRLFGDSNLKELYEFYEFYKKEIKKREDRCKRMEKTLEKYRVDFRKIFNMEISDEDAKNTFDLWLKKFDIENRRKFVNNIDEKYFSCREEVWKLFKKYYNCIKGVENKQRLEEEITFERFKPSGKILDVGFKDILEADVQLAENTFYGFCWKHPIEDSPDFSGNNFDVFEDESIAVAPIEVQIIKPIDKKVSKKGKNYYSILVEDSNYNKNYVYIWEDEYERFKDEFSYWHPINKGKFLKLRLQKPDPGFNTYKIESFPRNMRYKIPKEKKDDYRVILMQEPEYFNKEEKVEKTNEDVIIIK